MTSRRITCIKAVALAAALAAGSAAVAQEKKVIKFGHVFPANHWHYVESVKIFQDKVTKGTNGRITFESYHAGQLGKEGFNMVTSGMADFAIMVTSYEPAKMPLTSVSELPGLYNTSCEATAKLWNIVKDGGVLNNAEFKPAGIKVLYTVVMPPYGVLTTKKKISSQKDLAGVKLRANGAAMDKTLRLLGAVPVRVTSNEFYDALSRGTVDGGLWPIGSTRLVGLENLFKYAVYGPGFGGGSNVYGMSQKVWDSLSADDKAVMTKAGAEAQQHICKTLDDMDKTEEEWMIKNKGYSVVKLSNDEHARWVKVMEPVAADWAKDMDASGRPGSAMLKAFRESPAK